MSDQLVYLMLDGRNGCIKVGISRDPIKRERTLQSEQPLTFLFAQAPGGKAFEKAIHARFATNRVRGEWFSLTAADVQQVLSWGFEVVDSGSHYFDAYSAGMTYEQLTKERLIASATKWGPFEENDCTDDGDLEEVHSISDGLEAFWGGEDSLDYA